VPAEHIVYEDRSITMGVIPTTIIGKIQFYETHLPVWAVDPTAIGLTALQLADLSLLTTAARADFDSTQSIRDAARASTLDQKVSVNAMQELGGDLVKTIRAFAETTNDDTVFSAAQIPPPAPPTPAGPPDMPTEVSAEINNFGYVLIKWKGSRSFGTQFVLQRQLTPVGGAPGTWTYAGSSTTNDYTDTTVPTGFASVSYRVYAQRAGGISDASGTTTIAFGTGSGSNSSSSASSETGGEDGLTFAA
jgi:hypothetical protein